MKNIPLRTLLALACIASLPACNRAKSGAEAAVRETMKDPDSAKFGNFYYNGKTEKGCLTVNGKNSMGGYTGNQQAYLERTKDGWEAIGIADITLDTCRRAHADQPRQSDSPTNDQ